MKETAQWYIFTIFCLVTFSNKKSSSKLSFFQNNPIKIARNCKKQSKVLALFFLFRNNFLSFGN